MTIVSIKTAIAMKCSFMKHFKRNLDSTWMHWVPIYKIELSICNHSHSIPVAKIVRIVTFDEP